MKNLYSLVTVVSCCRLAEPFLLGAKEETLISVIKKQDPSRCCNYMTLEGEDDDIWMDYEDPLQDFLRHEYAEELAPATLITADDLLFTPPLSNADVVVWNTQRPTTHLSVWNATTQLEGTHAMPHSQLEFQLKPMNLEEDMIGHVQTTTELDGTLDHIVVMLSLFESWLDALGYLAYLRQTMSPDTRLVLVGNEDQQTHLQEFLEYLDDQKFQSQIIWVPCVNDNACNQRLEIRGDGTLKLLKPESSPRHAQLLTLAREWIATMAPPASQERNVIYYKPVHEVLTPDQHVDIVLLIQDTLAYYGRPEQVHVFDEGVSNDMLPLHKIIELFQSASLVIGPNVGLHGLQHLLLAPMGGSCHSRPKLLELLPSRAHFYDSTIYKHYSTLPWMECHAMRLEASSSTNLDSLDLLAFQQVLQDMLWTFTQHEHELDHREA